MEALPSILFNVLSAHPALTIRSGFANNDVPTGVQIVGRAYDDNTPFAIALHLQRAATVPTTWPTLPTPSSDV
jgi:amidase/aspartyl-tRNA(Asn)/glutamyl-tRNA(Gln) amidotransferase subunit A